MCAALVSVFSLKKKNISKHFQCKSQCILHVQHLQLAKPKPDDPYKNSNTQQALVKC